MNITNNKGHRTDLCDIPDVTDLYVDSPPCTTTCWILLLIILIKKQ